MHQGGAILAHIWAKNAFHHFVLIGLLEQYTKFKSKTFKLTFIFAMVTKNGHQNGLKNGKANILEQIWDIWHLTEKLTLTQTIYFTRW